MEKRQSLGQIEISIDEFQGLSIFEFMEVLSSKVFEPIKSRKVVCIRKSNCFVGYADNIHTEFVREVGTATVFMIWELLLYATRIKYIFQYTLLTDLWDHQIECVAV